MFNSKNRFLPSQPPISLENLQTLYQLKPRRFQLSCEWRNPLKAPGELSETQNDWNLIFPFENSFVPAFDFAFSEIQTIGWKKKGTQHQVHTFLKDVSDDEIDQIKSWISKISNYVGIRDFLCVSFALDYERERGNPDANQTEIGQLRSKAKLYGNRQLTEETINAANLLADKCVGFLNFVEIYQEVDGVVSVPPRSKQEYSLPIHLAKKISEQIGKENLSGAIWTSKQRGQLKDIKVDSKLSTIYGTMEVDSSCISGKNILLLDDLYQSGTTINYTAKMILDAGAERVFGLTCEKTIRNDDNLPRRGIENEQ